MAGNFQREYQAFKASEPGHRFEALYERRSQSGSGRKAAVMAVAGLMIVGGLALMVLPGPGIPLVLIGLAMIAQELRGVARMLDRLEVKARGLAGARG